MATLVGHATEQLLDGDADTALRSDALARTTPEEAETARRRTQQ